MKLTIYTSCSINYLPKARALSESLRRTHPDCYLALCLNDVVPDWLDLDAEPFDVIWQPQDLGYDRAWIFQHNVMELCTAVKGRALLRLLERDEADYILYLDPDVYVFNPLDPIDDYMAGGSIGLTPHILRPEETDIGVRLTEMSVTEHGIYNLGHLVVRPDDTGRKFAQWWADRLDLYCFDDRERGLFTDQRWVDLVPALFEGVRIIREPTLNVASWNLFGRQIRWDGSSGFAGFTVDGQQLLTYHFSGTGPNGAHRRVRDIFDPTNAATAEIERLYEQRIHDHEQDQLASHPFGFDHFDDRTPVTSQARKLYRRHGDLQTAFPDPYLSQAGETSYQTWLRSKRPGVIDGISIRQGRLDVAFRDLFDAEFYLEANPDAAEAIRAGQFATALDHYCSVGSALLLDPNPLFISTYYFERARFEDGFTLRRNAQLKGTLLWHYLSVGLQNAIEPIEFFDSRWYLQSNPDLMAAFRQGRISSPLAHFLHNGNAEGRNPGPLCDAAAYERYLTGISGRSGPRGSLARAAHIGELDGRVAV